MQLIQLLPHLSFQTIKELTEFYITYRRYKRLANSEELGLFDLYPCLYDALPTSPFDPHYFYQGIWAFEKILRDNSKNHTDIGSDVMWVGLLSTITKVTFIDIRPFSTQLENLTIKKGNILKLPYDNCSVDSLSCLHVIEHIGLGRYGDKLNPKGSKNACIELQRILSVNGNLYFSTPVGKEVTYFNAHRVHSPETIIRYFDGLKLLELSGVTDSGQFIKDVDIDILENSRYACGLFWFTKEKKEKRA